MRHATAALIALLLASPVFAAEGEAAVAAVTDLGKINGQALACGEKAAVSRAKELMLRHAPKTSRFGEAFEQATQQGFLGQVNGTAACPAAQALAERLDVSAKRLGELLPAEQK